MDRVKLISCGIVANMKSKKKSTLRQSTAKTNKSITNTSNSKHCNDETQESTSQQSRPTIQSFPCEKIKTIAQNILESELLQTTQSSDEKQRLTLRVCERIKFNVKDLIQAEGGSRYKVVVYLLLGESVNADFLCVSRFMWDKSTDNFAEATWKNGDKYAVAVVYGVYQE